VLQLPCFFSILRRKYMLFKTKMIPLLAQLHLL